MRNRYAILSRGVSSILGTSRDFLIWGRGMNVNAVKHQAKLLEWKDRVADCRSSGMSVKHWCEENGCSPKTYYRWEQEILGKVRQIAKAPSQPVLAELPLAKPVQDCSLKRAVFVPAAVIRIGQMELELSNTVSAELLSQLKGLMRFCVNIVKK